MIRRFNRFELKYLVSLAQRDALLEELGRNMRPDPHGDGAGTYRVTSLYYDSRDLACFRAKAEGIKYRRKVRMRIYGAEVADAVEPVLVEIKQRINRTVQKRRLALPLPQAYALCDGVEIDRQLNAEDAAVAAEVRALHDFLQLKPSCVITYLRQAWIGGIYEPGLRITFDHRLGARGSESRLGPGTPTHSFLPDDRLVLEVKVNDAVPLWVARALARADCRLRRISKYCSGLAHLRSLPREVEQARSPAWTSS